MSQPPYDIATYAHIVQTKFVIKETSENPLQPSQPRIESRNPHHPQYSQKNLRYECGCGFKGEVLDFTIISKSQIPSSRSRKQKTKEPLPNHTERFMPVMIGSDIIQIKYEYKPPYIPKSMRDNPK